MSLHTHTVAPPETPDIPSRPGRPTGWVPVRKLAERHRERVLQHLLTLDEAGRVLRFGYLASDERLRAYAMQLDFARDEVFGIFNRRLQLVAMAHLAFGAASAVPGGAAEFGVSVLAPSRAQGLGSRLFEHAAMHARNRGVGTLLIHLARDNAPMLAIVRRAGATVGFDGSQAMASLKLPADTLGSQIEELLGHHAAELDYRLKLQVLRLDGLRPGGA